MYTPGAVVSWADARTHRKTRRYLSNCCAGWLEADFREAAPAGAMHILYGGRCETSEKSFVIGRVAASSVGAVPAPDESARIIRDHQRDRHRSHQRSGGRRNRQGD